MIYEHYMDAMVAYKVAAAVVEDPGGGRGVVGALQDLLHRRGF